MKSTMMMMTTVTMPAVDRLFAVAAAIEIAFAIAFVIASLLQRLNYGLVYALIRHMDLERPDADRTHACAMHLYCVKHVNKHYMHTCTVREYMGL